MKLGAILSTAGSESVIDADGCSAEALRNLALFQRLFSDLVNDLELTPAAEAVWKIFPGEAGLTGLWMLQESHLTVHTFPEFTTAAINLYCCKQRRKWAWESELQRRLGATSVSVRLLARGHLIASPTAGQHVIAAANAEAGPASSANQSFFVPT